MSLEHLVPESKPSDHRLREICQKDVEKGASTRKIWNPLGFKKGYNNSVRPEKNPVYSDTWKGGEEGFFQTEECQLIIIVEWVIKLEKSQFCSHQGSNWLGKDLWWCKTTGCNVRNWICTQAHSITSEYLLFTKGERHFYSWHYFNQVPKLKTGLCLQYVWCHRKYTSPS